MPQHQIIQTINAPGVTLSAQAIVTADTNLAIQEVLAAASTNVAIAAVIVRANIKSIVIQSTTGDLTIKTNSSGSPSDTVTLTSGQTVIYAASPVSIGTNPFPTADVTELYLSSTAGTTFNLNAILNN